MFHGIVDGTVLDALPQLGDLGGNLVEQGIRMGLGLLRRRGEVALALLQGRDFLEFGYIVRPGEAPEQAFDIVALPPQLAHGRLERLEARVFGIGDVPRQEFLGLRQQVVRPLVVPHSSRHRRHHLAESRAQFFAGWFGVGTRIPFGGEFVDGLSCIVEGQLAIGAGLDEIGEGCEK